MHAKEGGAGVGLAAHMRAESEGCVELKCLAGNPIELRPVPCALSYDACPLSEPTGSTVPSRSHCLSVRYLAGHSTLSTTTADATSCGKLWHWALCTGHTELVVLSEAAVHSPSCQKRHRCASIIPVLSLQRQWPFCTTVAGLLLLLLLPEL